MYHSKIPVGTAAVVIVLCGSIAGAAEKLSFNRDVRPILAENCFACHGSDKAARKGDLRLDVRDDAVKAGAVVPGKLDESTLVERILSTNAKQVMPPPKAHKKLTAVQKETLKQWIAAGAEYQAHWSLLAPTRSPLPAVNEQAWVRTPVDRFILADLEKQGLKPAPEADRRTLARRLSLDLIGLPPTPGEVDVFVNDPRPDAYEKYVDQLLHSPHWGEHRGRFWLDAARFADTHGIHFDNYREIWAYRDWVINAFNRNLPFDQFTVEQLAGDLLPNRTMEQLVASGFNRCNITTNEGGAINEEYLVLYTRDRTETTAQVWLGLTAGCAVCHDHKFDPLSQKEFYSLAAFFNNTTQGAMDGNIKDTAPTVVVPSEEDRPRWAKVEKEVADARTRTEARKQSAKADFDKWLVATTSDKSNATAASTEGLRLHAGLSEGDGNSVTLAVDGKPRQVTLAPGTAWGAGYIAPKAYKTRPGATLEVADVGDFDVTQSFSYGAWVMLPKEPRSGAVFARMDDTNGYRGWDLWIENGHLGAHVIHTWPDDALKVVSKNPLKLGQWNHLFVTYDGSAKADGVKLYVNGEVQPTNVQADRLKGSTLTPVALTFGQRKSASRLDDVSIQDVRVYGRTLPAPEVDKLAKTSRAAWLATLPAGTRTDAQTKELFTWWLTSFDPEYQQLAAALAAAQHEEAEVKKRAAVAYVMQEKAEPAMAHVLFRGDYDKRRDAVKPATPKALPALPAELPGNRLGLAKWLLRPEHPLTTRVTVNRFWQELFGTGIVRTSGDFGVTGDAPSHPELLDWLAVEFRESGWDVKKFFKLLVTSAAYRQSALTTPEKLEKDPANRLLSRGPRFRMDAEMIRDYALASSGLLVPKLGGPSVRPYQPEGVWEAVAMPGSNTRDYRADSGENLYRRSMYTFWKRSAPPASMDIFNAPNRETCVVRRERTNTPLQALVTLNDVQFIEAARTLAQKAIKEGGREPDTRIDLLAKRLLCRPLRPEELKVVRATLDELVAYYQPRRDEAVKLVSVGESKADPAVDPSQLAAWTMVVNELLNLDEVLNK